LIGWQVIVPLGLASLLTGLVQSLGTAWVLFRHYWVLLKFVLTVIATVLLLLHMTLADRLADTTNQTGFCTSRLYGLRIQIIADAAAAVVLLIVNTVLSVHKPSGKTRSRFALPVQKPHMLLTWAKPECATMGESVWDFCDCCSYCLDSRSCTFPAVRVVIFIEC
jgi:hypothetical protein